MKIKKKSVLDFDELNKNSIEIYYEPMQIDIGSKERRRELAELLTDAFLFFFAAYETYESHKQYGIIQKEFYEMLLADKVSEAVSQVTGIDDYMSQHIREMSKEVVNTTFKYAHTAKDNATRADNKFADPKPVPKASAETLNAARRIIPLVNSNDSVSDTYTPLGPLDSPSLSDGLTSQDGPKDEPSDSYWLSYRRAEDIAKSESNTFLNYTDYLDAKESGKTKKTWLTMLDDKVRQTHNEVEGQTIGIDEMFTVGDSLMKFPHDLSESPNPTEVIGCRCSVEYK